MCTEKAANNNKIDKKDLLNQDAYDESYKNLAVLRIIYGASFSLGFFQLGSAFPIEVFSALKSPNLPQFTAILIAVLLVILSIRFYWAVGNIRRYLERKRDENAMIDVVGRRIMMFHVPVLLLHSFLFFILCRIYSDIATGPKGFYVDKKSYTFFYVYVGILLINFKWLYLILRIKYLKNDGYIRNFLYTILMAILPFLYNKDDNTPSHSDKPAGLWMMNNLQIAMLSIIILIIPFEENQADLIVITVALFYNSLIDLYINGYVYIFRKEG